MLELPEAAVLSDEVNRRLLGKRIEAVEAAHSPHKWAWFYGDPADYPKRVAGRTIDSARSFGGLVAISAEDVDLFLGDGVTLRLVTRDGKLPSKHQLRLDLDDGSVLVASVQMYGGLWACPTGERPNNYVSMAMEKPSPLCAGFDRAYFASVLAGAPDGASVKAALATEQRIPGLGNGVLQDILFAARLHPKRKMATLGEREREALFDACSRTLRAMYEAGGRDTETLLDGKPGGYRTIVSRKTVGTPCPICSEPIEKASYLGGSVYFCPGCQVVG